VVAEYATRKPLVSGLGAGSAPRGNGEAFSLAGSKHDSNHPMYKTILRISVNSLGPPTRSLTSTSIKMGVTVENITPGDGQHFPKKVSSLDGLNGKRSPGLG